MIGVRRFLGGGSQRSQSPTTSSSSSTEPSVSLPPIQPTAPLNITSPSKPSWPPSPLANGAPKRPGSSSSSTTSSSPVRAGIFQRGIGSRGNSIDNDSRPISAGSSLSSPVNRIMPAPSPMSASISSSNTVAGPSSPSRPMPSRVMQLSQKSVNMLDPNWKRPNSIVDTRDEMLMSLLASEAIVDSRDFDILSAEEVEELKKEYQVLDARLGAMSKKLKLETKIRDAAASLAKVNAGHKNISKQSSEQLDAANRKVDSVQKELWRISERSNEISKKLLEHRAGVLSVSLRNLEAKVAGDTDESGYSTSFRSSQMSPTSSETSYSSSRAKFEGPHLFAGHEKASQPLSPRKPPTLAEIASLEEKLKDTMMKLQAATEAQTEGKREIGHLMLEKEQIATSLGMELQNAEETMAGMRAELSRISVLETQVRDLSREREEWFSEREARQREIDVLERRLEVMEAKSGETLGVEMRVLELESAHDSLQSLMGFHGIAIPDDASADQRVRSLEIYLDEMKAKLDAQQKQAEEWENIRRKLQEDATSFSSTREALVREVEEARHERNEARREARLLESRLQDRAMSPAESVKSFSFINGDAPPDVKNIVQALLPAWNALPSPEARASKFGQRTKSPVATPGSPNTSLSELDVRLLKTLYDGRPAYQAINNSGSFSIEAFVARVQALIVDDRALIERLIRFAQAHDLLKKNAERAQKLAQESSVALETYQKQVKVLEDRNMKLASDVAALQDEVQELQDAIDKVMAEKREVETNAAAQAEACRQLTEANNTLSAKTLSLAEEAASAPEAVRTQLEKQLADCKTELEKARDDLQAMRAAEASQNIALMDELNHMQGENENLRAQLRAIQAGGKK